MFVYQVVTCVFLIIPILFHSSQPSKNQNINLMGSSESRQASVSLLLQAAFAFQSCLRAEKRKILFGNILWYVATDGRNSKVDTHMAWT